MVPQQQPQFVASFALFAAATRGDIEGVKAYLKKDADVMQDNSKALRMAAAGGHHEAVELLLKAGANPEAQGTEAMMLAVERNDTKVIFLLLEYKSNPNFQDAAALRLAAALGNTEAVMALVKGGADVYATPFMPAVNALDCAETAGKEETAAFLEAVMSAEKEKFLSDMAAAENCNGFMRKDYEKTREPALVRALKMGCLDEALEKMKKSSDRFLPDELRTLRDREGRNLRRLAAVRGELMKLFEPALWKNSVADMQRAWNDMPSQWLESGFIRQSDFDTVIAEHRQKILKSKTHKYKL